MLQLLGERSCQRMRLVCPPPRSETSRRRQMGHLWWSDFDPHQDHDTCPTTWRHFSASGPISHTSLTRAQKESLKPCPEPISDQTLLTRIHYLTVCNLGTPIICTSMWAAIDSNEYLCMTIPTIKRHDLGGCKEITICRSCSC